MRPIPATRLGDAHGLLRAIEQRGRLRTDEFVTEFNLDELFPPGLENALGRMRHFISFGRLAGLVKEDRGVVELTDIGKRYVRSGDPEAPYDVSSQQAEWLRRQLRERHMTDSIFHGLAIGLSLLASVPAGTRISTMDFGRSMAYLGRAGWDNENTLLIQGERHLTLLTDLELIDADQRLTPTGEQVRGELTLPVHMSLPDIAAQLNPGGAEAVRAAALQEFAEPAAPPSESAPVVEPAPTPAETPPPDVESSPYRTVISSATGGVDGTHGARPPVVPRPKSSPNLPVDPNPPGADPLLPFAGGRRHHSGLTPGDPLAGSAPPSTAIQPKAGAAPPTADPLSPPPSAAPPTADPLSPPPSAAPPTADPLTPPPSSTPPPAVEPAQSSSASAESSSPAVEPVSSESSSPPPAAETAPAARVESTPAVEPASPPSAVESSSPPSAVASSSSAPAGSSSPPSAVESSSPAPAGSSSPPSAVESSSPVPAGSSSPPSAVESSPPSSAGSSSPPPAGATSPPASAEVSSPLAASAESPSSSSAASAESSPPTGQSSPPPAGATPPIAEASPSAGLASPGAHESLPPASVESSTPPPAGEAMPPAAESASPPPGVGPDAPAVDLSPPAAAVSSAPVAGSSSSPAAAADASPPPAASDEPVSSPAAVPAPASPDSAAALATPTPPSPAREVFVDGATIRAAAIAAGLRLPPGVYANVAAALGTGKHVLLTGAPGSGKTALAMAVARAAAQEGKARGATIVTGDPRDLIPEAAAQGRWVIVDELDQADLQATYAPLSSFLAGIPVTFASGEATPADDWRLIATWNGTEFPRAAIMRRFAVVEVHAPGAEELRAAIHHETHDDATAAAAAEKLVHFADRVGVGVLLDAARHAAARQAAVPTDPDTLAEELVAAYITPLIEP
ncbi:hypothetical protein OJ997_30650 [Solirubrobacter phytolaccae]|uniref:AAA+ ATPase domain-containing protein n=1 Tax=Solirubrobacter phytolaccae TaxID=1404360 RepID=A0A9X3NGI8_9ACTN|nr:hypothetical protein [Solirubrobacter phytolaccae]MDA0184702.1 hypothetical protein [Solirubrobacter phytolaccae]